MQHHPSHPLSPLLLVLAGIYAAERRPGAYAASRALIAAANTAPDTPLTAAPVPHIARQVLETDPHPSHDLILAALPYIRWTDTAAALPALKPDWADGMLVNELVGPSGRFFAPDVRIGLYVQLPGFHYGLRTHPAEETYALLGGRSAWATGNKPFRARKTGALVHHPSMIPHQTLTRKSGFIASWRWSGEIGFDGYAAVETA